jgi:hypothetical protein
VQRGEVAEAPTVDQLALQRGRGVGEAERLPALLGELGRRVDVDVDRDHERL